MSQTQTESSGSQTVVQRSPHDRRTKLYLKPTHRRSNQRKAWRETSQQPATGHSAGLALDTRSQHRIDRTSWFKFELTELPKYADQHAEDLCGSCLWLAHVRKPHLLLHLDLFLATDSINSAKAALRAGNPKDLRLQPGNSATI
ncbi:hypothetical protein WJX77_011671 [Trebouxia sp. C0004]